MVRLMHATEQDHAQLMYWRLDSVRLSPSGDAEIHERRWYGGVKLAGDFVSAFVLLVLTWPLILVGALLVKLTSRGPAFYTQTRLGRAGRPFTIYKLRTMTHNCE